MSWNNTVTCSHCYNQGHNRRGCPSLKEYVRDNPGSWTARRHKESQAKSKTRPCGYCKETGHNRKTCADRKTDLQRAGKVNAAWRNKVADYLKETGLGIGAVVQWGHRTGLVVGFDWVNANFRSVSQAWEGNFLIVRKFERLADRGGTGLRLPTEAEVQGDEQYGGNRIDCILSPISSSLVAAQIPSDWVEEIDTIKELYGATRFGAPTDEVDQLFSEYFEKSENNLNKDESISSN